MWLTQFLRVYCQRALVSESVACWLLLCCCISFCSLKLEINCENCICVFIGSQIRYLTVGAICTQLRLCMACCVYFWLSQGEMLAMLGSAAVCVNLTRPQIPLCTHRLMSHWKFEHLETQDCKSCGRQMTLFVQCCFTPTETVKITRDRWRLFSVALRPQRL